MSKNKNNINTVLHIVAVFVIVLFADAVFAQTDSVYWDFGTAVSPVAEASISSSVNVSATNCIADTGNTCCTLSSSSYSPPYITSQFSSSGYTGASGQPTIRNNCKSGAFNASTSTYLSFTVTPNSGYALTIKGIEFAALGVYFGPTGYTIRTSADGFSTDVGTGSLATSYGSSKKSHTGLSITDVVNNSIEIRVYAYGGYFTTSSGDFFMDDIVVYYDAVTTGCSTPDTPANLTVLATTFYGGVFKWNSAGNALSYEYAVTTSATPPVSGTNVTDTVLYVNNYYETVYPDSLQYLHVRSKCDTFSSDWVTIDFETDTIPDCDTPLNVTVSNITMSSADVAWSIVGGVPGYEYELSQSITPSASGTYTTDTSFMASSLTDNTIYYAHVRTTCVDTFLYSDWVTDSFTTVEDTTTDTFKVVTYNLLNYGGSGRETYYRTIMDSINADIVVVQELTSSTGFYNFLNNVLNYTTSAYSGATFVNGPDTDNGLYYKGSKFQFVSNTAISTDLRDINQFKLVHKPSQDTLIIYAAHLKAGSTSSDELQRAGEVDDLRTVTDALDSGKYFLVCGDFNIYGSGESAYTKLKQNGSNVNGKFNDIISMSGTWNNSSYAIHHTQSPRTTSFGGGATGGLDDRFDMLLFSNAIINAGGFDILSGSYLSFGNDGQHYNSALNTPPYTTYPSAMLSAIHDASDHLPVVVQLRYNNTGAKPGKANSINVTAYVQPENKLIIFPNPVEHILHVKLNGNTDGIINLNMFDISGKVVGVSSISANETSTQFNVTGLASGVYYLKAVQLNEVYKVVIK